MLKLTEANGCIALKSWHTRSQKIQSFRLEQLFTYIQANDR